MNDTQDRVVGVLLGLAAGDQIGGPVRMALRVAKSLQTARALDLDDIAARYHEWWHDGAFDTGPTVAQVLHLIDEGESFESASLRVDEMTEGMTAGCNPAHRSAPLAMCRAVEDESVTTAAIAEAQLTHRHPLAGDVAAAVTMLCRALIRGEAWPEALSQAAVDRRRETKDALHATNTSGLSPDGFAPKALEAAVHFVTNSDSFAQALTRSIEFAGPANYCPVLVGSIGGARWGSTAVEDAALDHHNTLLPRIRAAAKILACDWED